MEQDMNRTFTQCIGAALIILDVLFGAKHHAPEVSEGEAS